MDISPATTVHGYFLKTCGKNSSISSAGLVYVVALTFERHLIVMEMGLACGQADHALLDCWNIKDLSNI